MIKLTSGFSALALALLGSGIAHASVIYDESISGDLSNSGLTPTVLTVSIGSNQIFGTTGAAAEPDRDYFTFTVPTGLLLSAITILPGTQSIGPSGDSFFGVQVGPQVTVPVLPPDATGLLGWIHYDAGDVGTNILPEMGLSDFGATGFTPPLSSGTYSFWLQEGNVGTVPYGLDFTIVASPEPGSWSMLVLALALFGIQAGRKRFTPAA